MEAEMARNGRILLRPWYLNLQGLVPTDDEVNYYVDTIVDVVRAEIDLT